MEGLREDLPQPTPKSLLNLLPAVPEISLLQTHSFELCFPTLPEPSIPIQVSPGLGVAQPSQFRSSLPLSGSLPRLLLPIEFSLFPSFPFSLPSLCTGRWLSQSQPRS